MIEVNDGVLWLHGKIILLQGTGKSLSESPIFASTNPQYEDVQIVHWITS